MSYLGRLPPPPHYTATLQNIEFSLNSEVVSRSEQVLQEELINQASTIMYSSLHSTHSCQHGLVEVSCARWVT
jgi:hypothetical protein